MKLLPEQNEMIFLYFKDRILFNKKLGEFKASSLSFQAFDCDDFCFICLVFDKPLDRREVELFCQNNGAMSNLPVELEIPDSAKQIFGKFGVNSSNEMIKRGWKL